MNNCNNYSWMLAYNVRKKGKVPDYDKFKEFIGKENILSSYELDFTKNPVFAVSYIKSNNADL